jgi:hypothetical protein
MTASLAAQRPAKESACVGSKSHSNNKTRRDMIPTAQTIHIGITTTATKTTTTTTTTTTAATTTTTTTTTATTTTPTTQPTHSLPHHHTAQMRRPGCKHTTHVKTITTCWAGRGEAVGLLRRREVAVQELFPCRIRRGVLERCHRLYVDPNAAVQRPGGTLPLQTRRVLLHCHAKPRLRCRRLQPSVPAAAAATAAAAAAATSTAAVATARFGCRRLGGDRRAEVRWEARTLRGLLAEDPGAVLGAETVVVIVGVGVVVVVA